MKIKNIIFDLGNVILNTDHEKAADAFKKLGLEDFESIYSVKKQEKLFDEFEKGNISDAQFRDVVRQYINQKVTDAEIDKAWNAMLLDVPSDKMELLNELKSMYRLFLLSNTNVIHVKSFTASIDSCYGSNTFGNIFEKTYYSCFMHMRKPDAEIFECVISENKLMKTETVFIDDSLQHVEGAKASGINGYLLEAQQSLQELVKQIL